MATKLVLNRREGVVAAQDVHLNRSVYSKPLVYSVNEDLSTDKAIKFKETIRLAPKANIKEMMVTHISDSGAPLSIEANIIYAQNNLPSVKENLVTFISDKPDTLSITANVVYAQNDIPKVMERLVTNIRDKENSLTIEQYFNTIILDNFKDSMSFQPIKFKETFSEPKD